MTTTLTPPNNHERGPAARRRVSLAEKDPNEVPDPNEVQVDLGILDRVRGHQFKRGPFSEPILGLEILDGPYAGITFAFTSFTMLPSRLANGMIPTRYETEVLVVPAHLKGSFTKDEAFDDFTSEIVIAWLSYLHTNDLSPLIHAKPVGPVQ